jgi:hypothetical protein
MNKLSKEDERLQEKKRRLDSSLLGLFLFVAVGIIITLTMIYKTATAPPSDRPGFKDMGTFGDRPHD